MKSKIKEYKDAKGEWRINQTAVNGNITDATSEGYKNRKDARTNRINASIAYLKHYKLSFDQLEELRHIAPVAKQELKEFFIYFATNGENFEGESIEFLVDEYLKQK